MAIQTKKPVDVAERAAQRRERRAAAAESAWRRETFRLPRDEARAKAREFFERFPKAAYMTEIEFVAGARRRRDRVRDAPPADCRLRRLLCLRSGRHPSALCRSDFESG